MTLLFAMSLAAPAAAQQGACPPDPSAEVERGMAALWEAFSQIDETAFDRSGKALAAAVACLDEVPGPMTVSRLHQAMALISFANGQSRASRRSMAAVRLMDPTWKPPDELFPPEHPFRDVYASATDPGPVAPIGRILPEEWIVDGVPRDEAPVDRSFLLQVRSGGDRGEIVWSGYLFDPEEIPDRGQSRKRTPLESPHQLWLTTSVHGGALVSRQIPEADNVVWAPMSGSTFAGGADLTVRYTPITVVGAELAGSILGPGDPVLGGGGLPSGTGVLLLGGGGWVGGVQPFASARIGVGLDRIRAWPNAAATGEGPQSGPALEIGTVRSAVFGVVTGLRSDRHRGELLVDGQFAELRYPYRLRLRAEGGAVVVGPLAVEAMAELRASGMSANDGVQQGIGQRNDTDVRVGGSLSLWL